MLLRVVGFLIDEAVVWLTVSVHSSEELMTGIEGSGHVELRLLLGCCRMDRLRRLLCCGLPMKAICVRTCALSFGWNEIVS